MRILARLSLRYRARGCGTHQCCTGQATAAAGGAQLGVQIYQCFVDERIGDGRRVTASRAFLPQGAETLFASAEGNAGGGGELSLRSHCTAAEIVLDDLNEDSSAPGCRRARGVRYLTETGAPATATARQEVIVCAGVIGSPQLLLLSGIGPRSAFESHSDQSLKDGDDSGWKWPQCKVCCPTA